MSSHSSKHRSRPVVRLEYQAKATPAGAPLAEATIAAVRREERSHGFRPANDGSNDLVARVASLDESFMPAHPLDTVRRRLDAMDRQFAELSADVQGRARQRAAAQENTASETPPAPRSTTGKP